LSSIVANSYILSILFILSKMLARILEPELMDTDQDARQYDAMDHAAVNTLFVTDLVDALKPHVVCRTPRLEILDLGAGTAQIPIELCRRVADVCVVAIDAAEHMLAVARENVAAAGLAGRIELRHADAKRLPFVDGQFPVVTSNSILHHIAEPAAAIVEAVRVTARGGLLFHRDLCRPNHETELEKLVETYAGDATPYQQKLFADSLRAALTVAEMQALVAQYGFAPHAVRMTSDRHWTWVAEL
jgi:ubiquinone/menaquinone biosynthesis C-methylase UbiE